MKITLISIFHLILCFNIFGQEKEVSEDIAAIVFLDSFVVTASQSGFNVADFIDIVQKDESFYRAFHNLRFQPHTAVNQVEIFNRKREIKAANYHTVQQFVDDKNCRTMTYLKEEIQGKFYKKKKTRKHKYYTARLHEQVFLTRGKVCGIPTNYRITQPNLKGIDKQVNELKKLIFQPGKEVDVPFIGKKTAIFKKKMVKFYDFYIINDTYNEKECYTFRAVAKQNYSSSKTIIKYLETYFDKKTFQVLGRNYHLKYNSLFDFDVRMKVALTQIEEKYIPKTVVYEGNWKIPTQSRERVKFNIEFDFE